MKKSTGGENQVLFKRFGTMIDCSRNAVMNVNSIKKWIDLTADLGYNLLSLYMEDTYEVDGEPYFGYLRGRYSKKELKEIDLYAKKKGIEVVPSIQTLAHLNQIFRWPKYRSYNDADDILLVGKSEVYELIDRCFKTIDKCFTSKTVNIGMDEAFMLGRGKYYDLNGQEERVEVFLKHLKKVAEIGERYGFKMLIWSDMLTSRSDDKELVESIKNQLPKNVELIYWDYYSTEKENYDKKIKLNKEFSPNAWFAGGLWSWTGFAPHNVFSIKATEVALKSCIENGVSDVLLTLWGDNGGECSRFALLPALFYASEIAKGNDESLIKQKFEQKYGIPFDGFLSVDMQVSAYDGEERTCNPDKYILYNDCFSGIMDSAIWDESQKEYETCAENLSKFIGDSNFGYVFKTLHALSLAIAEKSLLGIQTREAYKKGDLEKLRALVNNYDLTIKKVEDFHKEYKNQWMTENKPHGFIVQDVRIGGVIMRLKTCKETLIDYLLGKIERIEELEEDLLDCADKEVEVKKAVTFARWDEMTSVCKF